MKTTKLGMFQIATVTLLSFILGSPAIAHKKDSNDEKWHGKVENKYNKKMLKHREKAEKWQKWFDKKLAKHDHEFDDQKWHEKLNKRFDRKMLKHPEKAEKWQKWFDKKLAKHNAKHHADVVPEIPPADDEPVCTAWFNGVCVAFAN